MTRIVAILIVCVLTTALPSAAQSVPPTNPEALKRARVERVNLLSEVEKDAETKDPGIRERLLSHPSMLPLVFAGTRAPDGDGRKYILEFYQRSRSFSPADQVQFLYGFGAQKRKGLASDLFASIFPGGWRLALGSSVTAGEASQQGDTAPTPEQSIQRLRDGGDMYLTLAYPLLAKHTEAFATTIFFVPRTNFLFSGFAGTETITESTEHTTNVGAEWYLEFFDLEKAGAGFAFARVGWQHVSPAFQRATGLDDNKFFVSQFAIGATFNDLVRVSFQRFTAPPAAAGVTFDDMKGWHLVLQLTPKAVK